MKKLRLMSLFVEIVACGSISKASEKLDLSKSVISTALKQLESELGTCLLKRTTRKQALTSAGEQFYLQCAQMTNQAEAAWLEASEFKQVPSGRLTVTAPHVLMRSVVLPALIVAFRDYPQVYFNLISDDKQIDIVQQDIDLAIRVGASEASNLKQRKIGQFHDILCRAKATRTEPEAVPYISHFWEKEPITHVLLRNKLKQRARFNIKHKANTLFDVIALIELGEGVGLVPEFIISEFPKIEPVPGASHSKPNLIFALHPFQTHTPLAIKMAIQAIQEKLPQ